MVGGPPQEINKPICQPPALFIVRSVSLIAGGQWNVDAFLLELVPNPQQNAMRTYCSAAQAVNAAVPAVSGNFRTMGRG